MKPTEEQTAIIDTVVNGRNSLLVNAVAGSGKTTTIVQAANEWSRRYPGAKGMACAFNKDIANVLRANLPRDFNVATLHSHGLKALRDNLCRNITVNKFKVSDCLQEVLGDDLWNSSEEIALLKGDFRRAMSIVRSTPLTDLGIDKLEISQSEWTKFVIEGLAHHGIFLVDERQEEWFSDIILKTLMRSIDLSMTGVIDFDDMLFMPVYIGAAFDRYDLMLVDESQDISPLQLQMIQRSTSSKGRVISVGDRNQAIYGWRGADAESMDKIKEMFNADELPMTLTFRCPKAVVSEAQLIVPQIRCSEAASEGDVYHISHTEMGNILQSIPSAERSSVAILCRNRKPLIELAFYLRRRGIRAFVLGSDLAIQLNDLIRKWDAKNALEIEREAQKWKETQMEIAKRKRAYDQLQSIEDKADCLITICENVSSHLNSKEIMEEIKNLFAEERKSDDIFTLSTIHKAKGLEWSVVFFYRPDLIPNKYCSLDWQLQQERNLSYVCVTRSLSQLYYVNVGEAGSEAQQEAR